MSAPRAVITGIGIVTPIGSGKEKYWGNALKGTQGIRKIEGFDTTGWTVTIGGEVRDIDPYEWIPRELTKRVARSAILAMVAAKMAQQDAGIIIDESNCREIDVFLGTTCFDMETFAKSAIRRDKYGAHKANPLMPPISVPACPTGNVSIALQTKGETMTISTACSSGLNAIAYARKKIQWGNGKVIFAGGVDVGVQQDLVASYAKAGALSVRNGSPGEASRPFEADRDGQVLSEATAIVVVEEYNYAVSRGAHIYAEITGHGTTSDAHSMAQVCQDETEAVRAIKFALDDAQCNAEDIDYYCAHGSSSRVSDSRETRMLKRSLGKHAYKVPVTGLKGMMGHSFAAAGAVQTATCALALDRQEIPPTINYTKPDPECDLDYIPNNARQHKVNKAMTYSLGMGNNAALVLSTC